MLRSALVAASVLTAACASAGPPATERAQDSNERGWLFIVGGGPRPEAMMRRFVELAGGSGRARIVVVPTASGSPEESGRAVAEELRGLGAEARVVHLSREQAMTDSAVRLFNVATGIWFGGGDQSRITAALEGTPVERAVHAAHRRGAVIGGTSAGAAVMSDPMITGDERRPGGDRPDSTRAFITIDRENIVVVPAFGLLEGVIIDQHFVRRRRHNRLISLVLEHPTMIGAGIDESTALLVAPDGEWQVIGHSTVLVYDARGARIIPPGRTLGAAGVRFHILPAGSRFDPRTGAATLPSTAGAATVDDPSLRPLAH